MTTYELGDVVTVTYSPIGYDVATCAASLTLTAPDGTVTTPAVTEVDDAIDHVTASLSLNQVGAWYLAWASSGAVVDALSEQIDVAYPAPPLYATLTQLRDRCGILDNSEDDELLGALQGASRQVEKDTRGVGERYTLDALASAREYTARGRVYCEDGRYFLLVDDIGSTDGLLVNGAAPALTSPQNALAKGRAIEAVALATVPSAMDRITVVARWGWPSVPQDITQATLLRAHRLFRRRGSPEGVAGFADMGAISVRKTDPDYEDLTTDYARPGLA